MRGRWSPDVGGNGVIGLIFLVLLWFLGLPLMDLLLERLGVDE